MAFRCNGYQGATTDYLVTLRCDPLRFVRRIVVFEEERRRKITEAANFHAASRHFEAPAAHDFALEFGGSAKTDRDLDEVQSDT